ncbi:hypothetical protein DFQ26_001519, partial [Actinomortierella ambigua]
MRADAVDTNDACYLATSAGAGGAMVSYKMAKACLEANFPFPTNNRNHTATNVNMGLAASYVYQDLVANPPLTYPPSIAAGLSLVPVQLASRVSALANAPPTSLAG